MEKYHFNIRLNNVRYKHAGSKAVDDARQILLNAGFKDLQIAFQKKAYLMPFNLIRLLGTLLYYRFTIKPGSLILAQYPLIGINKLMKPVIRAFKVKKCVVACLIHDIDAIRTPDNTAAVEAEIKIISDYDAVIAHNASMAQWLKDKGYPGKIVPIGLFDYLIPDSSTVENKRFDADVVFAGNLGRCGFLEKLNEVEGVVFNLYGPGIAPQQFQSAGNIRWKGVFTPEEIVSQLDGRFGLIWDGDSIEQCTGVMGEYIKYNTPHKVSLYLTCGIPVIVPETAAVAAYVKTNNIGISIARLSDLTEKLPHISQGEYKEMQANTLKFRNQLINGKFLLKAVDQLEQLIAG